MAERPLSQGKSARDNPGPLSSSGVLMWTRCGRDLTFERSRSGSEKHIRSTGVRLDANDGTDKLSEVILSSVTELLPGFLV